MTQPNIVFVFTDQERYFDSWPQGMDLPGRERLQSEGVSFEKHYAPASMCTSSRSVMITGLQTPDTKMFDNSDMRYVAPMSYDIPTVGDTLRMGGYYTAYKGKWHLNAAFDVESPERLFTAEMNNYGFSDYMWPGDVVGKTLGGYKFDDVIGGTALAWLRNRGRPLTDEQRPWALFVSLVKPARHHVLQHRSPRRAGAGHRASSHGSGTRTHQRPLREVVEHNTSVEPRAAIRRVGPTGSTRRVRPRMGVYARSHPAGRATLATAFGLLPQQHPICRPPTRALAHRARQPRSR